MYQTIHEPITVAGVFCKGVFTPKKFKWLDKVLQVSEVTRKSLVKDGGRQFLHYGLVAESNVYRLMYCLDNQEWWLEEVWVD